LILSLVVAMLAVSRLTMLLVDDKLTVGYRQWVVRKWGEESMISYLVHCPWCTSIWVAIPIMPVAVLLPNVWTIAALSIPAASLVAGLLSKARD
jgi:hypothetical protein